MALPGGRLPARRRGALAAAHLPGLRPFAPGALCFPPFRRGGHRSLRGRRSPSSRTSRKPPRLLLGPPQVSPAASCLCPRLSTAPAWASAPALTFHTEAHPLATRCPRPPRQEAPPRRTRQRRCGALAEPGAPPPAPEPAAAVQGVSGDGAGAGHVGRALLAHLPRRQPHRPSAGRTHLRARPEGTGSGAGARASGHPRWADPRALGRAGSEPPATLPAAAPAVLQVQPRTTRVFAAASALITARVPQPQSLLPPHWIRRGRPRKRSLRQFICFRRF